MKKKKNIVALLSLSLALGLTACGGAGPEAERNAPDTSDDAPNTQIANPFTDYATRAEAEAAAGYAFAAPDSVDGYPEVAYGVMNGGELFQIVYSNDADDIMARKAPGADDISGDYNEYAEETLFDKTDTPFTVKGKDGKAFLALWTDDENGFSYSLMDREGMEMDAFSALVMEIQDGERADNAGAPVTGGWTLNGGDMSLDANPDAKAAFEKAVEGLEGYAYEPIAYLGSQVVAGTNYRILCRGAAVISDATPNYEIVTVYEDLQGGASITDSAALMGNCPKAAKLSRAAGRSTTARFPRMPTLT